MLLSVVPGRPISEAELEETVRQAASEVPAKKRKVLVLIPDDTRTAPVSTVCRAIAEELAPRTSRLVFLVALGTHAPMDEDRVRAHLGIDMNINNVNKSPLIMQHRWDDPSILHRVGVIPAQSLADLSGGLLSISVPIEVNKELLAADFILIVNPVFPHEVVGFSGGHKYFFPGVSGPQMVNVSHWLGALITSPKIIGQKETPVRQMIETAAEKVQVERAGLSMVMDGQKVVGLFYGDVYEAWSAAADLSATVNIVWSEHAYRKVISIAPLMYRDLWTAGKCMYKLEPIVEDGGEIIIYAPHIAKLSYTHQHWLLQLGYHVRDFYVAQWSKYKSYPWAVLADSTLTKGIGTFIDGIEKPRIKVTLATSIPPEICQQVNLGYEDPKKIDVSSLMERGEEGTLVVPNAGEKLWRLASGEVPDVDELYKRELGA